MSNICFKYKNQEDPQYYYYISEDCFVINERCLMKEHCEEYEIIKKIQKMRKVFLIFLKI